LVSTPQDLERLLREQVRAIALAEQKLARPPLRWYQRMWARVQALWLDTVHFCLLCVALGPFLLAVVILVTQWPPGGGGRQSSLAIEQGASLIFVVILVGLMSGPLEAGRQLGRGTEWVARDSPTWIGLGIVALLSLALLTLGWIRPDRYEEAATIALTASGLGVTGLVARRLLRLSDPTAQLSGIYGNSIEQLRAILPADRHETNEALTKAGVDQSVSAQVGRFASPSAQRAVSSLLQAFTTIAAVAWRDGDWQLGVRAHSYGMAVAREYVQRVEAADGNDLVITTIVNESDDLHELAGGPDGRKLSQALVMGLAQLGREIASRPSFVDDGHVDAVFLIVHEFDAMVLPRRLADPKSVDPAAAIRGLGGIGLACVESGAPWGAITTNEKILGWATAATSGNVIHVAIPAWEESLQILVAICRHLERDRNSLILDAVLTDLHQAMRKVEALPPWSMLSAIGPILRSVTDGTHPTLQVTFYVLWEVAETHLEPVAPFGRHVAHRLVQLLQTAPETSVSNLSEDVGEVMYQWIAAAATRADAEPEGNPAYLAATDSIANILGWLRSLIISEGRLQEDHDLDELLHMYVSGWEMLLYLFRDVSELSDAAGQEYVRFLEEMTPVSAEMPEKLHQTLGLFTSWLKKIGAPEEAARAEELAAAIPRPTPSPWDFPTEPRWGMGREYFTRRGGLIPAVVSKVETYFRGR
jgi:hypothetical protein